MVGTRERTLLERMTFFSDAALGVALLRLTPNYIGFLGLADHWVIAVASSAELVDRAPFPKRDRFACNCKAFVNQR